VAEFILETAAKGGKRADGKKLNWNKEWLNSENAKEVKQEIQRIKTERSKVEPRAADDQHEFASPVVLQTSELTKRLFIQYWRDPAYLYGKLFVSVIVGIFNGFTFWQLGYSKSYFHTNLLFLSVGARSTGAALGAGIIPWSLCPGSLAAQLFCSVSKTRKISY
jgi:hypothetical protein